MKSKSATGKLPFISKFAYGMGDVGCNFSWMFVGNFLMIFYTDAFVLWVLTGFVLLFYKLNRKIYDKIFSELQHRKGSVEQEELEGKLGF